MATNDDEAELAVLELALAEELGGEAPPDLWPRVMASLRPAAGARPSRWLAAALLAIGVLVVGALMALPRDPRAAAGPDQRWITSDPAGPRDLAEAQLRLAAAARATIEALAVRSAATGRLYSLRPLPLEDFFRSQRADPVELDGDVFAAVHAALRTAVDATAPAADAPWTQALVFAAEEGAMAGPLRLLAARSPDGRPLLAFAGRDRAIGITAASFPHDLLQPLFADSTKRTIAARGLVLGDAGFDHVPTTTWRLRLCEVNEAGLGALARFPKLSQLDLTHSPACHSAAALSGLANVPLRSLVLRADRLDAVTCATLGSHPHLTELFLAYPDWIFDVLDGAPFAAPTAKHVDDAAVANLAALQGLAELTLCGGSFGDRGLAALARLPKLRRLALVCCPNVTPAAWFAFEGHGLTELNLPGCAPPTTPGHGPASLPALQKLGLGSPHVAASLAALASLPALAELRIDGRLAQEELDLVAHLPNLRKLTLRLQPPLRDGDLARLHGATQLRRLQLASEALTAGGLDALRAALPQCTVSGEAW